MFLSFPLLASPSFDCDRILFDAERIICNDLDLSAAEARMTEAYRILLLKLSNEDADSMKREQQKWLRHLYERFDHTEGPVKADDLLYAFKLRETEFRSYVPDVRIEMNSEIPLDREACESIISPEQ